MVAMALVSSQLAWIRVVTSPSWRSPPEPSSQSPCRTRPFSADARPIPALDIGPSTNPSLPSIPFHQSGGRTNSPSVRPSFPSEGSTFVWKRVTDAIPHIVELHRTCCGRGIAPRTSERRTSVAQPCRCRSPARGSAQAQLDARERRAKHVEEPREPRTPPLLRKLRRRTRPYLP